MRKMGAIIGLGAALVLGHGSPAGATHTGCEHSRTQQAHQSVPHRNHGTHTAHSSIPYCPPQDAPRQ